MREVQSLLSLFSKMRKLRLKRFCLRSHSLGKWQNSDTRGLFDTKIHSLNHFQCWLLGESFTLLSLTLHLHQGPHGPCSLNNFFSHGQITRHQHSETASPASVVLRTGHAAFPYPWCSKNRSVKSSGLKVEASGEEFRWGWSFKLGQSRKGDWQVSWYIRKKKGSSQNLRLMGCIFDQVPPWHEVWDI